MAVLKRTRLVEMLSSDSEGEDDSVITPRRRRGENNIPKSATQNGKSPRKSGNFRRSPSSDCIVVDHPAIVDGVLPDSDEWPEDDEEELLHAQLFGDVVKERNIDDPRDNIQASSSPLLSDPTSWIWKDREDAKLAVVIDASKKSSSIFFGENAESSPIVEDVDMVDLIEEMAVPDGSVKVQSTETTIASHPSESPRINLPRRNIRSSLLQTKNLKQKSIASFFGGSSEIMAAREKSAVSKSAPKSSPKAEPNKNSVKKAVVKKTFKVATINGRKSTTPPAAPTDSKSLESNSVNSCDDHQSIEDTQPTSVATTPEPINDRAQRRLPRRASKSKAAAVLKLDDDDDEDFGISDHQDSDVEFAESDHGFTMSEDSAGPSVTSDSDSSMESDRSDAVVPASKRRKTGIVSKITTAHIAAVPSKPEDTDDSGDDAGNAENVGNTSKLVSKNKKDAPQYVDKYTYRVGIDMDLAPISKNSEIFADMTNNALKLGLEKALNHLNGHVLKVATMCSGTESPILALQLFQEKLKDHGINFEIDHLFSAEIVPFKQAYIERNFNPPIMFRDIRELSVEGATEATTAYGGKATIPDGVDMLVAGFSCVDFSGLNNKKKGLAEGGESGDTFSAITSYAKKYRPRIMILENVSGAPWKKIEEILMPSIGYSAHWQRVDTKDYYIPHTRVRGYMICIDTGLSNRASKLGEKWAGYMNDLKRAASSSVEAFLLDEDDPRVIRGRAELAGSGRGENRRTTEVDWARCHGRHQDYRAALSLGQKRPIMNWEDGGSCKPPYYMWQDWALGQVERVWDTIDVSWLRNLNRGFDHAFKIRVLELSQNVDRVTDNSKTGITGCITPTGIPFSTLRGGPLIGLEALALQGLPIDKLQLTRENQAKLQDLAGNAMSSTVVGAAMLSALLAAFSILPANSAGIDLNAVQTLSRLHRQHDLVQFVTDTAAYSPVSVDAILQKAAKTVRLCLCEGRAIVTKTPLQQCYDCNHTTCTKCGIDASHRYGRMDPKTIAERESPTAFEALVKDALPMKFTLAGITMMDIEKLRPKSGVASEKREWTVYSELMHNAFNSELRYHSAKRSQIWTIYYESDNARLELIIDSNQAEWRLFAKPINTMKGNNVLRKILAHPIARMRPNGTDIIMGSWQLWASETIDFKATIQDTPNFTPSFENLNGLGDFADTWVSQGCLISVSGIDTQLLDQDITGSYKLLQNCAGPSGSLHIKEGSESSVPLYFFLDPDRLLDPKDDCFIFSHDRRRLNYEETRPRIACLKSSWRQTKYIVEEDATDSRNNKYKVFGTKGTFLLHPDNSVTVNCSVDGSWRESGPLCLKPSGGAMTSSIRHVSSDFDIVPCEDSCQSAHVVLTCQTSLREGETSPWKKNTWLEVDQLNQKEFFASFAWLMEKTHKLQGVDDWRELTDIASIYCTRCAPALPKINWKLDEKWKLVPYENQRDAATYERHLKARPSPLITQVLIADSGTIHLKLAFNPETLIHRAVAALSTPHDNVTLSWRLVTDYITPPKVSLPRFTIKDNDNDPPVSQPPNFRKPLRNEQLRSLGWMLSQEADTVTPFIEEEVEEADVPQIGWRGEGRAEKPVLVRGGILADQVGFGKTITTLALIAKQKLRDMKDAKRDVSGRIAVKATLILLPKHLTDQWLKEITKFFVNKPNCLYIATVVQLQKMSLDAFRNADIIVAPWTIFEGDAYLFLVAQFAGLVELPENSGMRAQAAWYDTALDEFSDHVEKLKGCDRTLQSIIDAKYKTNKEVAESVESILPSKRLRGKAYQDAKLKTAGAKRKSDEISTKSKTIPKAHQPKDRKDVFGLSILGKGKAIWTSVKCPLLEMFEFSRLVVDEYTYVSGKDSNIIPKIRSKNRWILSGTPPMQDFADIKSISTFLGINLGVDDLTVGVIKGANIKNLSRDQTSTEEFRSFKSTHSFAWHENRHALAQKFLDQFMRQNIADIEAIEGASHIVPVTLPAAERAIYLELVQLLAATGFTIKKGRANKDNDRAVRIRELLAGSSSAGEALMKCASHFTLRDLSDALENAPQACDVIVETRESQCSKLISAYKLKLKQAVWLLNTATSDCVQYNNWKERVSINWYGDSEAVSEIQAMIRRAEGNFKPSHRDLFYTKDLTKKSEEGCEHLRLLPEVGAKHNTELRNVTNELSKLSTELVARKRGLRFFKVVRQIQQLSAQLRVGEVDYGCTCSKCGSTKINIGQARVLSLCGHVLCEPCLSEEHVNESACPVSDCNGINKDYQIVPAVELGVEDTRSRIGQHWGKKLEDIIELINSIPENDQVLLFVQFDDLTKTIEKAFKKKISYASLTDSKSSKDLEEFKESTAKEIKVLILNIGDASAAGSNLTNANHIIFVSPYLAERQYTYTSAMTQAIGRARRYGQTKPVHVYHFLSLKTIDVDVFQARSGGILCENAEPSPSYVPFEGFVPSGFDIIEDNGKIPQKFGSAVVARDAFGDDEE